MQVAAANRYGLFKAAIFALLAANAAGFLLYGRATEALDSLAWFALLALFELETAHANRMSGTQLAALVHTGRVVAGIAVVAATAGFVYEREWLDAMNGALWIAVVVVLELEIRCADAFRRWRAPFVATAGVFYAGLAALVLIWTWRGEWFDAWDAALWLVAFGTIEMNLLRAAGKARDEAGGP